MELEADAGDGADEDRGSRRRNGRRRPADSAEERQVEGTVELLANGSGFVRVTPPEPSDEDVYISAAQVRRCELVTGDAVSGPARDPRRSERYPSLVRVDTINGRPADEVAEGTPFDEAAELAAVGALRARFRGPDAEDDRVADADRQGLAGHDRRRRAFGQDRGAAAAGRCAGGPRRARGPRRPGGRPAPRSSPSGRPPSPSRRRSSRRPRARTPSCRRSSARSTPPSASPCAAVTSSC